MANKHQKMHLAFLIKQLKTDAPRTIEIWIKNAIILLRIICNIDFTNRHAISFSH